MTRTVRACLLAVVVLVAGAGGMATGMSAALSAPVSDCTATHGTIVAVDFGHWGGPVVRGCDASTPGSGAQLLFDEGFTLAGDQHDGPGFVCRLGNTAFAGGTQYPTPAQDPCVVTPPANAYWSYWLAPAGADRWSYSANGPYADQPRRGEVQLWTFGGTHLAGGSGSPVDGFPVCSPDSLRAGGTPARCTAAPKSAHPTSSTRSPAGHASSARGTPSARPTAGARTAPATRRSTAASSAAPATPASSAPTTTVATPVTRPASSTSPVVVAAQPADRHTSTGSVWPLVLGVLAAALLLGGGGVVAWRRHRADE